MKLQLKMQDSIVTLLHKLWYEIETCIVVKDLVNKLGRVSEVAPMYVSNFEMIEKSHFYKEIDKKASN
jgi:hypothetical protein